MKMSQNTAKYILVLSEIAVVLFTVFTFITQSYLWAIITEVLCTSQVGIASASKTNTWIRDLLIIQLAVLFTIILAMFVYIDVEAVPS